MAAELKANNMSTPFKMKGFPTISGTSPMRQDYREALDHHKKFQKWAHKTQVDPYGEFKHAKPKSVKQVLKQGTKKGYKKLGGKVLSKFIPGAGWALLAHDAYKVGTKMKGGHSLKEALKSHYLGIEKEKPRLNKEAPKRKLPKYPYY